MILQRNSAPAVYSNFTLIHIHAMMEQDDHMMADEGSTTMSDAHSDPAMKATSSDTMMEGAGTTMDGNIKN